MAKLFSVDWHGTERLTMTIKGSGERVRQLSSVVIKNNTEKVKAKAKELVGYDTGFEHDHIKSSYPNQLEGHVTDEAAYGGYQEYGTRFQAGHPHMRPALWDVEKDFQKEMTDIMKGVFK
ncbi:HK97-gp10 family putative phage morphogenesis protein [Streptococcus sp. zg-JUN1979]|uniref:HK97-gp10 family putative phage morphogenesis protein n=1 Tax=Streptococcus sp. zg-JUN1979 TaxID=3391450 RepID=UPI0039A615CC